MVTAAGLNTTITVANIVEVVTNVIKESAGNDISNQLNNSPLTRELVGILIAEHLKAFLSKKL